jgi:hypothetical protein
MALHKKQITEEVEEDDEKSNGQERSLYDRFDGD